MSLVSSSGYAHVRLTVTDIARSKAFYDQVFGWPAAIDQTAEVDDPRTQGEPSNFYGGVIYATPQGTLFGLRPVGAQTFDSEHTGLDHVSFMVESRSDLERAAAGFDEAGIAHGEILEFADSGLALLSFQDPDDINIELTAPLA
ncbi:MAG: glyoxalase [Marmoricola sp.]|nr:glyoxalase [Marmoricola sp.]